MGRPKKKPGEATRNLLLRAAEKEFGRRGFDRARLEDIAAAAGIRRSSLLYYFGSKEQLYREVVVATMAELRAVLASAMAESGSAVERLEAVAEALLRFADERRAGITMFIRELLDRPPASATHMRELVGIIDALEEFLRAEAGDLLPPGAPLRAAVLHVLTSQALRMASGELGDVLWGDDVDPRVFIRTLLQEGE
jgi:AcrR family transcriptional regulator